MADQKLTALTALATLSADDLFYVVDDPAGAALSRKLATSVLDARFASAAQGALAATAVQPGDLATVAFSGDYGDLVNTPAPGAPVGATYIVQTPDGTLTNEQALSALATGLVKNTTTTGVLSIGAAGTDYSLPSAFDTRANILATTPTAAGFGFATDTAELFVYSGGWYVFPLEADAENAAPDIGPQFPMVDNDKSGYSAEYITDKTLQNVRILENALTSAGAVRVTTAGIFQVYLNGAWADIMTGFRLREDPSEGYEFEQKPTGFTEWLEILSGNGDTLSINGLPIIQQYIASMGAYPVHIQIQGRAFS